MRGGDIPVLMQNFDIPQHLLLYGDKNRINEFAAKMVADQPRRMNLKQDMAILPRLNLFQLAIHQKYVFKNINYILMNVVIHQINV